MKRTPLRRGSKTLHRKVGLRQQSKRREQVAPLRRELVARVLEERPWCEVCKVIDDALDNPETDPQHIPALKAAVDICVDEYGVVRGISEDVHEPLTRARGGSILDPANTVATSRAHHEWLHAHPALSLRLGLLRSSWDGGQAA